MSFNTIIDPATNKIFDALIPEGGGINLDKGQLITALANQTEVAFPTVPPANGSVLSYDATTDTGLRYIANNPTALALNYQQLFSATAGNNITPVPAPPQNNYVLTSDTDVANPTGLAWKPPTGGGGLLTANAPLFDDATTTPNTIGINFTAGPAGQIPYGTGVARTGALTNTPANGSQFLGIQGGVPTWKPLTDSVVGIAPIVEIVGAGDVSQIGIGFSNALVGQIPYGNGTVNTGALTNAPTAGQILGMSGNPAVPTWIPAGGSGTITALAPLTEYAVGTASNIAIDFTAKGDLVVGGGPQAGGNPIAGVILPVGANDMVLTANSGTASGLEWKASGSGSSPIINRNSQDNTPLIITKPTTKNDTMILTTDLVFLPINAQIYFGGTVGGIQTITNDSFNFFYYQPNASFSLTGVEADIKLYSSALLGTDMVLALCANNDPTTIYASSAPTTVGTAGPYHFSNFNNLPFQIVAGTTYSFFVLITLAPGDTYAWYYGDPQDPPTSKLGNIFVQGVSFPAGANAGFTFPTGKFRVSDPTHPAGFNNASLISYTSQSFVATEDTNDWVVIGGTNGGVSFS